MDNILIVLIVILIVMILAFVIYTYFYKKSHPSSQMVWPPKSFMQTIGVQCPDYWVLSDGRCVNKFNVPVVKSTSSMCANVNCFDENSNNTKTFSKVDWADVKGRDTILDRCQWRDCCKTTKNIPYSWVGIDDVCGY